MWMYQEKYSKEKIFMLGPASDSDKPVDDSKRPKVSASAYMSMSEPVPSSQPYGCGSFMKDCKPGEVGGCDQYRQSCASADNSVRMSMARPGECDQFRRQCAMGDYTSCDLYNRACLYESS